MTPTPQLVTFSVVPSWHGPDDAIRLLRERYARGDIDDEEFGRRLAALSQGGPAPIGRYGDEPSRPLLLIQFLLLSCVLIFSVIFDPAANPHGMRAVIAAMLAVSAMACQFALLRLAVPGTPSTAVMTGNLTNAVLSLLDSMAGNRSLTEGDHERLSKTVRLLVGFFVGCVAGAAAVSLMGRWAWSLPVVLAAAAVQIPKGR